MGMNPAEYWRLTEGETIAKITGYRYQLARRSEDFRELFALTYNVNTKKGHQKKAAQLWPLLTDQKQEKKEMTHDEIRERNERIRKM